MVAVPFLPVCRYRKSIQKVLMNLRNILHAHTIDNQRKLIVYSRYKDSRGPPNLYGYYKQSPECVAMAHRWVNGPQVLAPLIHFYDPEKSKYCNEGVTMCLK